MEFRSMGVGILSVVFLIIIVLLGVKRLRGASSGLQRRMHEEGERQDGA